MKKKPIAWMLVAGVIGLTHNTAHAYCVSGQWICARLDILAQVVVVQPPPPQQPPPQIVIVQQPPPPPLTQPQPQVVIVQQAPPTAAPPPPPPPPPPQPTTGYRYVLMQPRQPRFGIHGHVGGVLGDRVEMGGATVGLRFRPSPHVGFDLGVGVYGGNDYNGHDRVEVPITGDFLYFVNPRDTFQIYGLAGVGVSFARTRDYVSSVYDPFEVDHYKDYFYLGGEIGIGVEWRLSQWFALNVDVRGFLRQRVAHQGAEPEFRDSSGRTTNTSGGALLNVGATIYL